MIPFLFAASNAGFGWSIIPHYSLASWSSFVDHPQTLRSIVLSTEPPEQYVENLPKQDRNGAFGTSLFLVLNKLRDSRMNPNLVQLTSGVSRIIFRANYFFINPLRFGVGQLQLSNRETEPKTPQTTFCPSHCLFLFPYVAHRDSSETSGVFLNVRAW